jgi:hypothetical protein
VLSVMALNVLVHQGQGARPRADHAQNSSESAESGMKQSVRSAIRGCSDVRWGMIVILGVGLPILAAFVLGPFALIGYLIGAALQAVGLGLVPSESATEWSDPKSASGGPFGPSSWSPGLLSTVTLTSMASILFTGILFGRSLLGHP